MQFKPFYWLGHYGIYKQWPSFGAKICSDMLRSRKTARFSEHIMSADKYPSIFSRQMKAIVYIFHNPTSASEIIVNYPAMWHTTAKQVISRHGKNENVCEMSKNEKCTCKACKSNVFHC